MKKPFKSFTAIAFIVLSFASCEKALMGGDVQPQAVSTFDYLWNKVDQQYSMFDVKGVDWQAVYDSLRPKVFNGMSSDSLFSVCATMLNTLQDGHVNLYAPYDVSRADSLYYDFYANNSIEPSTVVLNYLGINYHATGGLANSSLCNGQVIYIYYSSFSNTVSQNQLKHILQTNPDAKGIILDMRDNGGGSLKNVDQLLQLLPSHGQPIYYSQIKSGPAHDDFSPLATTYAPQVADEEAYKLPVVVLTDRASFSATSSFAVAMQAYDNVITMGDTTGGGMGLPTQGVLPNGWVYRFSITRVIALDGNNYENGVPPDVYVKFDREAAQQQGRDNIIDAAIEKILN